MLIIIRKYTTNHLKINLFIKKQWIIKHKKAILLLMNQPNKIIFQI